jgi:hypothetical protein
MTSSNELHDAAMKVIEEFSYEGKPFVLYLRKFDFHVLHGKNEFDRYLTDNYIATNLTQGINLITIREADNPFSRTKRTAFFPYTLLVFEISPP